MGWDRQSHVTHPQFDTPMKEPDQNHSEAAAFWRLGKECILRKIVEACKLNGRLQNSTSKAYQPSNQSLLELPPRWFSTDSKEDMHVDNEGKF
jgi:hypothetical protein